LLLREHAKVTGRAKFAHRLRTLSDLMGRPELARDSRFATLDARIVNQDPVGPRQLANTWRNSQFLWGVRDAFPQR
jgi:hypothetical protein